MSSDEPDRWGPEPFLDVREPAEHLGALLFTVDDRRSDGRHLPRTAVPSARPGDSRSPAPTQEVRTPTGSAPSPAASTRGSHQVGEPPETVGSGTGAALATGGNGGIGFDIADRLLAAGLQVVIGSRDAQRGRAAAARPATAAALAGQQAGCGPDRRQGAAALVHRCDAGLVDEVVRTAEARAPRAGRAPSKKQPPVPGTGF